MRPAPRTREGFVWSDQPEPHRERRRQIAARHPEIGGLSGHEPRSLLIVLGVVTTQIALASACAKTSWGVLVCVAWSVGAMANHALYVLIHECAHDLVFAKRWQNALCAVLADLPNTVPSALSFRAYHLAHHAFQGEHARDADLASHAEAAWVGRSPWRKAAWLCALPLLLTLRPRRIGAVSFLTVPVMLNGAAVIAFDCAIAWALGPQALMYLFLSFWFSIGPHPLAARWIQEHYLTHDDRQETASYYGLGNIVALNVGYHTEHHDFPTVPWTRLPAVRALAPEAYETLHAHRSWTRLLVRWLTDPNVSLFSRVTRG